jgi:succinyl-CoA synthetase beta subunit
VQLNEHLSKTVLATYGVPCGPGTLAADAEAAVTAAVSMGFPVAVKAQVPASGRGKAGGIKRADSADEVRQRFAEVTSVNITGFVAESVRVEPWQTLAAEAYLAVSFSEQHRGPVLLFSGAGGVEVEAGGDVSVIPLRQDGSVDTAALHRAARAAGHGAAARPLIALAEVLCRAYDALDARLIELNPVGIYDGGLTAVDARVIVDDNALFRQPDIAARVRASSPRPEEDTERERSGLELVPLPGHVGLISGGAGMTLATMDLLKESGADPACFLDCSANPTKAGYRRALEYVQHTPAVNVVLVSIFGGLTRIDKVARNICELLADGACTKPVVFRLMGAEVAEATMTLSQFGYANYEKLEDAVAAVVTTAQALRPTATHAFDWSKPE